MRKEKEIQAGKAVDDTIEIANDFRIQTPFGRYQPVPYREYGPFAGLIPVLQGHLDKLFSGEPDEGNGDVLDCIIADYARESFKDLSAQRTNHHTTIRELYIQRQGSEKSLLEHLKALEALDEENREEREEIKMRIKESRFRKPATGKKKTRREDM